MLGQRFIVDTDWWLDTRPAAWADDAHLTVSYQDVYTHIKAVVEDDTVRLIETLAVRVAESLLRRFPTAEKVEIRVCKETPVLDGMVDSVGVEAQLTREELPE